MHLVFYDLETTIPDVDIIEFGAIVLDRRGFFELDSFSTLIRSSRITQESIDCNGITEQMIADAPCFADVADRIYEILHGQIWAGHNIEGFDNPHIVTAFARIGRTPPAPALCIDTYPLIEKTFGPRAGNMKMRSLASYFGLGQQQHRAIDDCRLAIEILKNCNMTLFLEQHAGYASEGLAPTNSKKPMRTGHFARLLQQ